MAEKWTRKERKAHVGEKYKEHKHKFWVLIAFLAVFAILIYGIVYAAQINNTLLLVLLVIILVILAPLAIFLMDLMFWEYH